MTHPQQTAPGHPIPLGQKLFYSAGGFAITLLISSTAIFLLNFYTDVALVPPAIASSALLIGKVWDTLNDPLMGWMSDRTGSRHGRRRVYLIYGALPLVLTTILLFSVPRGLDSLWAFVWIALTYTLFDTLFTLVSVPYNALGAEMTDDYDERTSLMAVGAIGTVLGYVLGGVATRTIVGRFTDPGLGYLAVGAIFGGLAGLALALVAWRVREPARAATVSAQPLLGAMWGTLRNTPFTTLLTAFSLARLAFTLLQTMLVYHVTYVLGGMLPVETVLLILFVIIGAGVPVWKRVADRWGKAVGYGLGIGLSAFGVLGLFFVGAGQPAAVYALIGLTGLGMSAHWVLPWAMLPDVVEAAPEGSREAGVYYGVYGLSDKIMRTIGITLPGYVLQAAGYVPNVAQGAESLLAIRVMFALAPAVLMFLAVPVLLRYPLDRRAHTALRSEGLSPAGD
ncbi:MAG: MFS transporter [Anaerolineales bacterium]|nr:MFS transporter [Anaerolineales bacterium]